MYKRTYSLQKPNNDISKAKRNQQNDLFFDEIVLKGTSSDDSPPRQHKQPKNDSVRKHARKIKRKRNLEDSVDLFKDNFLAKKKDSDRGAKHSVYKCGKLKEISNMIETLSDSEGDGNSESLMLVEDTFSVGQESRQKFKTVSNLQIQTSKNNAGNHLELVELNLNESIETARESKEVSSKWSAKGLHSSPLVKVVQSDDDSFSSAHQSGGQKKKLASPEGNWVTISSDTKGTRSFYTDTGSSKKMSQSKYTYSYVSTYTDNTVTSKASSNDRTSPHVVIKKLKPKLNSTTCWNKDDIGTVQFPDFISPIVVKPIPSYGQTPIQNKEIVKNKCLEKAEQNHDPKNSTQLFVSISSSQTKIFPSLSLSAIKEASKAEADVHHQEEPTQKIYDIQSTLVKLNQDTIKAERELFKSSTPHYQNVPLTLDLSPIKSPLFDDDELCVNFSIEENTDEIFVPSLDQISFLSYDSIPAKPSSVDERNRFDENKVERNVPKFCSDDNGDKQNEKKHNYSKLNPVVLHDQIDHLVDSCSSIPPDHQHQNGARNAAGKQVNKTEKSVKRDENMKGAEIIDPLKRVEMVLCDTGAEIDVKCAKLAQCKKGDKMAQSVKGAKLEQSEKDTEMTLTVKGAKLVQYEKKAEFAQPVNGNKLVQSEKSNEKPVKGAKLAQSEKSPEIGKPVKDANDAQCVKGAKTTNSDCDANETFLSPRKKIGKKKPLLDDSEDTEAPDNNVCAENEALETNTVQNCCNNSPIQSPVGDEEIDKQESGCSKCLSQLNKGLLRGICFVSKLCISSQTVLKQSLNHD